MWAIILIVYLVFVIVFSRRTNSSEGVNFFGLPFLMLAAYFGYHFLEKVL